MPIPEVDPIVTVPMITPFDDRDQVDHAAIARNVERWLKTPLSGFIVGTQSGEEWFLSENEKLEIARTVSQSIDECRFLIGGIDCPSVTETLRRADAFAAVGAEMVRVRLPRNEAVVESYFEQVLPRCPVPVLLMHQCDPERFGAAADPGASPEVIGRVCQMDGIFGYVTDHDIRFEAQVRHFVPRRCRFWICNGSIVLPGTLIGCNGTTTAFSNVWPEALLEVLQLGMAGRYDEAQELQDKVRRIDAVMLPYRATGIKAALNLLGFDGTHPRSPTPRMPDAEVIRLEAVMRETGLLGS
ncbi:MAG: dihydrodipicolinate synthase family protein [Planctomycetes bacterium]|nr:dihydrodipicolinate synthase family protein [Planctomycetota bacterium]